MKPSAVLVTVPLCQALVAAILVVSGAVHAGAPVYIPPPPLPAQEAPAATPAPAPAPASSAPEAASLPAPAPARFRLLVLELKGNDVDEATVKTLEGIVTAGLAEYPELDVVSGDDLKNLLQLEAERASTGCSEDASCMAEIADALGAQLVVFGNAGRLGDSIVLNLNLFDSVKATGLGRIVVQAESTEKLPRKLRPKLRDLVGKFYADRGLTLPPFVELPPEPVESSASVVPWVVGVGGTVAALAGVAVAAVGTLPLLQYDAAKTKIVEAQGRFSSDPGALDDAKAAQVDLAQARASWNSFGWLAVDAGAALAVVGIGAGIAGLVWGWSADEAGAAPPASVSAPASAPVSAGGAQ